MDQRTANRRGFLQASVLSVLSSVETIADLNAPREKGGMMRNKPLEVRFARPTDRLREVVSFYRDAVGLVPIAQFEGHAGYSGVMLGIPGTTVHLEFTHADEGSACPAPTKDNLFVIYFTDPSEYSQAIKRMELHGAQPVAPENPYWLGRSYTFEDPDGWRVVLYNGRPFDAHR